jgi:hypothetical protein
MNFTAIRDRLVNLVTGLGTVGKDKNASTLHSLLLLTKDQLEAMYRSDWLPRKIIDIPAQDMTREWRGWQADEKAIEKLEEVERTMRVREKVYAALLRARLYGGAGLYLGLNRNERPELPLNIETVKAGSLAYIHVLNRWELTAGDMDMDPQSPTFGEPLWYDLPNNWERGLRIHPSRIIRFVGAPLPDPLTTKEPWGDSILQIVYEAVMNASSSQQHTASLFPEAKVDVISVPGLSDHLSTEQGTARITDRFTKANLIKSLHGLMLLENGPEGEAEVWNQKQIDFSQFPELLNQFLQVAAGAADIPVTRLLGQSPAGLNATGESDIRNYYDGISSRQETELAPALERLDEIVIRSALGSRPDDVWYEWNPLWQMTEKEKVDVEKVRADTFSVYARDATVPSAVLETTIKNSLIESGNFPGVEKAYEEFEKGQLDPIDPEKAELEEAARAAALESLKNPPDDGSGGPGATKPANGARKVRVPASDRLVAMDATPRTLYVSRKVKNASAIISWAKKVGFSTTLPASDLHVTIAFSKAPVDWFKFHADQPKIEVPPGGPRAVEQFGEGAIVLLFNDMWLKWRHREFKDGGASWDHEDYQPHITITYSKPDGMDLTKIEPYQGEIVLGPEIWEEIDENWQEKLEEV